MPRCQTQPVVASWPSEDHCKSLQICTTCSRARHYDEACLEKTSRLLQKLRAVHVRTDLQYLGGVSDLQNDRNGKALVAIAIWARMPQAAIS